MLQTGLAHVRTTSEEPSLLRIGEGFQEISKYKSIPVAYNYLPVKGRIRYRIKRENPK